MSGEYQRLIDKALVEIRKVLSLEKQGINRCDSVDHTYEDKFSLANALTSATFASIVNSIDALGVSSDVLQTLIKWTNEEKKSVTIEFQSSEKCEFKRETVVDIQPAFEVQSTTTGGNFMSSKSTTTKVVQKQKQFWYAFQYSYRIVAIKGNNLEEIKIAGREKISKEFKVLTQQAPLPATYSQKFCLNLTPLLQAMTSSNEINFEIDRNHKDCFTPRRNKDISGVIDFLNDVKNFTHSVVDFFITRILNNVDTLEHSPSAPNNTNYSVISSSAADIFVPCLSLTLFNESKEEGSGDLFLHSSDINLLLTKEKSDISQHIASIRSELSDRFLVGSSEGIVCVLFGHIGHCATEYFVGVNFIEHMLGSQLQKAIGKVVTPRDFQEYMDQYHTKQLFKKQYQPVPFIMSVRRSAKHSPEGLIKITSNANGAVKSKIIECISATAASADAPLYFRLNASTFCELKGDRHIHSYLSYSFNSSGPEDLKLTIESRQFSSFIVMIGTMQSSCEFSPMEAVIVKNKDELDIVLSIETIPTQKEFNDAIKSLSPEQQRFASSYRQMKLQSTLFAIVTVQIKPQLEKVLNLPSDSLTKEIALTQDITRLFTEFQISPDLLSYDGPEDGDRAKRLSCVQKNVKAIKDIILQKTSDDFNENDLKKSYNAVEAMEKSARGGGEVRRDLMKKSSAAPQRLSMARMAPMSFGGFAEGASASFASLPPPPAPSGLSASGFAPQKDICFEANAGESGDANAEDAEDADNDASLGNDSAIGGPSLGGIAISDDYTKVPTVLSQNFDRYDSDHQLRTAIIKVNENNPWKKTSYASLLADRQTDYLTTDDKERCKSAAFDLIDAITKSGADAITHSTLHVIIGSDHSFDSSLIDVIIKNSVNPIEKVERSLMIIASTIHNVAPVDLIEPSQEKRLKTYSSNIFAIGN